jgi:hypothetical protein
LALALKHTHDRYASYWNAAHRSSGHAWQGRFYSRPLDQAHLWEAMRYTELVRDLNTLFQDALCIPSSLQNGNNLEWSRLGFIDDGVIWITGQRPETGRAGREIGAEMDHAWEHQLETRRHRKSPVRRDRRRPHCPLQCKTKYQKYPLGRAA